MQWRSDMPLASFNLPQARLLGIDVRDLASLGVPAGAMVVLRTPGKPTLRFLLD
jgi:hypothetical protein